jgi:tRNA nucleotidyltransferase/poly(A) polymerase
MELHDTVGSKRMRTDNTMKEKEQSDATVAGLTLQLQPEEEALFQLLMQVVEHKQLSCVLRVAGGWVRDKIMGKEAHDIDIAIDTMMGQEFTQHLVDYMKENGREKEVGGVGVIKSNPDQSKHLETATLRVMGFELDFVNLRAEEYTDSRIPVMRIGTALEDAMRRDLTINALFYNINCRSVEDFTGEGMNDIKAGRVRTPLAPNQTMIDDPLRALRTVRFACRLGFELDEELAATLATAEVRDALASKVSKERVNTELNGMLLGPQPARALGMLHQFRLLGTVFATPSAGVVAVEAAASTASLDPEWGDKGLALVRRVAALSPELLAGLLRLDACEPLSQALPKDSGRLLYLAAMLSPLKSFQLAGGYSAILRGGIQHGYAFG